MLKELRGARNQFSQNQNKDSMKHYRQGDVLIYEVGEIKRERPVKQVAILAHGEATGHCHRIEEGLNTACFAYCAQDGTTVTELEVREAVRLVHEEHSPIIVEPGLYRVAIQVEEESVPSEYGIDQVITRKVED